MRFLRAIFDFVTLKPWRAGRIRRRYDELKALIVKEHLAGRGGMLVPRKFRFKELSQSFRPPMYFMARNHHNKLCIFWRKELMTEEVGPPVAFKDEAITRNECH
jgi:hypothetical protein